MKEQIKNFIFKTVLWEGRVLNKALFVPDYPRVRVNKIPPSIQAG